MITPIVAVVSRQIFSLVPPELINGAQALGGSRWTIIRNVVLPFSKSGIIGGAMLGLGRALGETIAVFFVLQLGVHVQIAAKCGELVDVGGVVLVDVHGLARFSACRCLLASRGCGVPRAAQMQAYHCPPCCPGPVRIRALPALIELQ